MVLQVLHLTLFFGAYPIHFAFRLDLPLYESGIAISEFKAPRSRAECSFREVTSIGTWQKMTAEECRIVQEITSREDKKTANNTQKTGFWQPSAHPN